MGVPTSGRAGVRWLRRRQSEDQPKLTVLLSAEESGSVGKLSDTADRGADSVEIINPRGRSAVCRERGYLAA